MGPTGCHPERSQYSGKTRVKLNEENALLAARCVDEALARSDLDEDERERCEELYERFTGVSR